jgi:hypothetical protein
MAGLDRTRLADKNGDTPIRLVDTGVRPEGAAMPGSRETLAPSIDLTCIECGRPWLVAPERWRLKVTDEEPRETVPYCPDCAHREFDE